MAVVNICGMKSSEVFAATELLVSPQVHTATGRARAQTDPDNVFHHNPVWVQVSVWMATAAEEPPELQGLAGSEY